MTENQKLREALLSDMDIAVLRMPVHLAFAGNMAQFQYHNRVQALLDRIEALATPTAEQVDDINVAESFTSVTKTAAPAQGEPFGYFRAEPFGWTDCPEDAEGAIALYEHPAKPAQEVGLTDDESTKTPFGMIQTRMTTCIAMCPQPFASVSQPFAQRGASDERH